MITCPPRIRPLLSCAVVSLLALGQAAGLRAATPGAALWHHGTIITMDGATPHTVAAVAERAGKIVYVGSERGARKAAGRGAVEHDLRGATLLPGFIDAHSHFAAALQNSGGLDLSDPAAPAVRDIPGLIAAIRHYITAGNVPSGAWVVAWQYDQENLAEHRHVTRAELDAAFPDRKVVLIHVSLHGTVASGAALAAAGVNDSTPVPAGGVMGHDAAGHLDGLMFERARDLIFAALPRPSAEQKLAALDSAQMRYLREGYTHAQDGATQADDLAFFTSPAARAHFKLDLALLPFMTNVPALLKQPDPGFGRYQGHVKLQGVKFVLDGSPQARTAFFTRDYANGAPDGHHPWHGQPVTDEATFQTLAGQAYARGWQLFVHANGDAAIDMAIRAFDKLGIKAADNRRPIVIHSQFMRPDQITAYARIGVGPAFFSNHTYYWADVHRGNFPPEVTDFISPFKAALAAGLVPSNHTDYPVTSLDTRMMVWTAMTRTSKTGVVSGADQRITAYQALQALTTGPAWQIFEENRKGRIKPGLLADFVVLDANPLTTPAEHIREIKVLETIKEGESVWKRGD